MGLCGMVVRFPHTTMTRLGSAVWRCEWRLRPKARSKAKPCQGVFVRMNWMNNGIGSLQSTCTNMLYLFVDKYINLELGMFACLIIYIYIVSLSCTNSLGSFGLTLVWCRCVSQVLVAPQISKCRSWGELWDLPLEAGHVDHYRAFGC